MCKPVGNILIADAYSCKVSEIVFFWFPYIPFSFFTLFGANCRHRIMNLDTICSSIAFALLADQAATQTTSRKIRVISAWSPELLDVVVTKTTSGFPVVVACLGWTKDSSQYSSESGFVHLAYRERVQQCVFWVGCVRRTYLSGVARLSEIDGLLLEEL